VWQFFVEYEFLERVATDTHCRNPGWRGLVDAYAAPLLVGTVPWLPLALWSAWKRRRIAQVPSRSQVLERQGAMLIYLWLGLPLCVFLASQSRLPL
jgi:cyanate permease